MRLAGQPHGDMTAETAGVSRLRTVGVERGLNPFCGLLGHVQAAEEWRT